MLNRAKNVVVQNSFFVSNRAVREGSALEMNSASGPIVNSTFVRNKVNLPTKAVLSGAGFCHKSLESRLGVPGRLHAVSVYLMTFCCACA